MKLLAIDTSGLHASWTGIEDGLSVCPVEDCRERKHDSVLSEGIRTWMKETGWDSIDGIAVCVGPGGYTGLRVGVAFATAFAASMCIPVLPISSFNLLAARVTHGTAWTLLPIRKKICRGRLMQGGDNPVALSDPVEVFVGKDLPPGTDPVIPVGEGYLRDKEIFDQLLGNRLQSTELRSVTDALAILGTHFWRAGKTKLAYEVDVEYGAAFQPTLKKKSQ